MSGFKSLVVGTTNTETVDVEGLLKRFDRNEYYIPDYQRDSEQWDEMKKSLFIESIINNFTVPPIIVCPDYTDGDEKFELVDGQQRLTTLLDFKNNILRLCKEELLEYADNVRELVQNKKFSELDNEIQIQILNYKISIVKLSPFLFNDLYLKLEIFRRINETGVPLSAQDLRLATFFNSDRVTFLRLSGIYDPEKKGPARMISRAKEKRDIAYPWNEDFRKSWCSWWKESVYATGQNPSEMFLFFVIAKKIDALQDILKSEKSVKELKLKYNKTIDSVLNIYCARLQAEDGGQIQVKTLPSLEEFKSWFDQFQRWFHLIKTNKVTTIKAKSKIKIALFIAAASDVWKSPDDVTDSQWENIETLLLQGQSKIKSHFNDFVVATPRGKWPAQAKQVSDIKELCQDDKKR